MNKNAKVIEIYAHADCSTFRTVQAAVSLDTTVADVCERKGIPMLAVICAKETEPMTIRDAMMYSIYRHAEIVSNPAAGWIKSTMNFYTE